ncbi:MAG: hypothetical protein DRJ15_06430 [Bacteroidetes bacterium]|nr:MAG: hypothetical protein DRJ15_06430 [Bacteroidota bacterium]
MNTTKHIHYNTVDRKLKDQFGNSMPYELPDGYFEDLPTRALESIRHAPEPGFLFRRNFRRIAAAAAIFLMAALVITLVFSRRSTTIETNNEFSMIDSYQNTINSLADLEEAYLMSLVDVESLNSIQLINDDLDNVSDEAIMEYLLAENHIEYRIINEY